MKFCEQLVLYMNLLNCSLIELEKASNVSKSEIYRYKKGLKIPNPKQLNGLINGLNKLAQEKNIKLSTSSIKNKFIHTSDYIDKFILRENFIVLANTLNINNSELARYMMSDPSSISKIRSKKFKISNPEIFVDSLSEFIVKKYTTSSDKKAIALLIDCSLEDINEDKIFKEKIKSWLCLNNHKMNRISTELLEGIDTFDINEYLKNNISANIKIPSSKPKTKCYYNIDEMKQGELDFLLATILSDSSEPITIFTDMPLDYIKEDKVFSDTFLSYIILAINKGLNLNIIHSFNKPLNESRFDLNVLIPLYMTGQVSSFYLTDISNGIYSHLNYTSGTVALNGECISGYYKEGKYYLTTDKKDVEYYKKKVSHLLCKATPLMEVYKKEKKKLLSAFLMASSKIQTTRKRIVSSLPIHTISVELLLKILARNNISIDDSKDIINSVIEQKQIIIEMLNSGVFEDDIVELSKEDFEKNPPLLSLSYSDYEGKIQYTYEEYLEHLNSTKELVTYNKNYKLKISKNHEFKNIQILICENNWVMLSKANNPSIHFIIHYSKLRDSIQDFFTKND